MSSQLKTTPSNQVQTKPSCSSSRSNLSKMPLSWRVCYRIPKNNSPGPRTHCSEENNWATPNGSANSTNERDGKPISLTRSISAIENPKKPREEDLPKIEQHYTFRPSNKQQNKWASSTEHPKKTNRREKSPPPNDTEPLGPPTIKLTGHPNRIPQPKHRKPHTTH